MPAIVTSPKASTEIPDGMKSFVYGWMQIGRVCVVSGMTVE